MMLNKNTGQYGEEKAIEFLKKNKYKIIEKNFRTKFGEIDIIGYNEQTICFVEVKTRSDIEFGFPEESVDKRKQRQIIQTAKYYLKKKKITDDVPCRFDVVAIVLDESGPEINLIKNAFTE